MASRDHAQSTSAAPIMRAAPRRLMRWVGCTFFGRHHFRILGRPTAWSEHYGCVHCGRQYGHSWASGRDDVLPWGAVASFYADRGYFGPQTASDKSREAK